MIGFCTLIKDSHHFIDNNTSDQICMPFVVQEIDSVKQKNIYIDLTVKKAVCLVKYVF